MKEGLIMLHEPIIFASFEDICAFPGTYNGMSTHWAQVKDAYVPIVGYYNTLPVLGVIVDNPDGADCWYLEVAQEYLYQHEHGINMGYPILCTTPNLT
jgi:hypothetical protein